MLVRVVSSLFIVTDDGFCHRTDCVVGFCAARWGDKGYFYMPYEYMCHPALASDFWAINWVEGFKNTSSVTSASGMLQAGSVPRHPSVLSLPMRTHMKFGWRPDMPDHRDLHMTFDKVNAPSHIKRRAEGDTVCLKCFFIIIW